MNFTTKETDQESGVNWPVVLHARVVSGTGGGPEKTILNSPRFLRELGYDSYCAYMRSPSDTGYESIVDRASQFGAPLISLDDRGPLDVRVISQMLKVCRNKRVAIWHGHDYKSNALGVLLRKFWKMRLVSTVHGWVKYTRRTPLYYGIDRLALRSYDHVVCVSEDLQERCLEAKVPAHRLQVIHNGIDCSQFQRTQSVETAKRQLGVPHGRLLIGAVGRLSAEKGFEFLIRSVDQLIREGLDLGLILVGEGDQHAELSLLIRSLNQQERIQLTGFQSEMLPLYEAMDVFAMSSIREGLPNVILEALAMGIPVLATEVAGLPSVIMDGETGFLVPIGDKSAWKMKLKNLLMDTDLRARLGVAGQQMVQEQYSFKHRMQQIAKVYDHVLGQRSKESRI